MSWATCYSGSNNIHFDLPALMSDARHFTSFDPNCEANNRLKKSLNIQSNYEYRQYLINNGNGVIKKNRYDSLNTNINQQIGNGQLNHHNKYIFSSVYDNKKPFGYQGADLKNIYLSRQQLQDRAEAPLLKLY